MITALKSKAAGAAKRAGLLTGGLLVTLVGLGFLTAAGWIYLISVTDTLTAALILGGAFVGVGLMIIGIASSSERASAHTTSRSHATTGPQPSEQPPLVQAFLTGMQAGVSATQTRH